jgi:hypothetical protein
LKAGSYDATLFKYAQGTQASEICEYKLMIAMHGASGSGNSQKTIAIDRESSKLNNIANRFLTIRSCAIHK